MRPSENSVRVLVGAATLCDISVYEKENEGGGRQENGCQQACLEVKTQAG